MSLSNPHTNKLNGTFFLLQAKRMNLENFELRGYNQLKSQTQGKYTKRIKVVGMACQKVCKQGRDEIKVIVNIQGPIPFSH